MFRFMVRAVVSLVVLLPHLAAAEPITLKLSFFVTPSQRDRDIAHGAFTDLIAKWEALNPRNRALLAMVNAEIAQLHAAD